MGEQTSENWELNERERNVGNEEEEDAGDATGGTS